MSTDLYRLIEAIDYIDYIDCLPMIDFHRWGTPGIEARQRRRSPFAFVSLHSTFGSKRNSSSTSFDNFILATLPVTPIKTFFCLFGLFVGGPSSSAILNCYYIAGTR